ncbi:guanylate kinase [Candidatus Ruminimicrobium bovinum]|uniref:guanylate kinase n=1 Tax=Candidatus Ruminimicrobium bovinum TaxID=3242779 RepID=UPI0039B90522
MKSKQKGMVIIMSAPSGAGKTSICDAVVKKNKNIVYSISTTTRAPRKGEKNGKEYFFVTEAKFKDEIKQKQFAEWAKVHNNYYGTSKKILESIISKGKDVLLDIDVQGAIKIKKQYKDALMIFIMTPSLKILKQRLIKRNKDTKEVINIRLKNAEKEISYIDKYDYLVINDKLNESIKQVENIINCSRLSTKRNKVIWRKK